jgi:preprotein translocase subunit SecD
MEKGLSARVAVIVVSLLASIWVLIPTFMSKADQDLIKLHAERAKMEEPPELESPMPWWIDYVPNTQINLGLDLQGGIDLTLEVEVDEAVLSTAQRDVQPLRQLGEREGVKLDDVRRDRRRPSLLVDPGDGVNLETVQGVFRKGLNGYAYEHTESIDGKDYLVFTMTEEARTAVGDAAVTQALETIRNRIDETGVKEPSITRKGDRGIDIQLPGETNVEQAVAAVGTTARLEFLLVDEDADTGKIDQAVAQARDAMPAADYANDRRLSEWLLDNGHLRPGQRLYWEYLKENGQESRLRPYVLKEEVVLSGDDVNDARTEFDAQRAQNSVSLIFKPRGQAVFAQVTGENVNKRFAIVLDDKVRSAPVITQRIDGPAQIRMGGQNLDEQAKEAKMLALVLRSGSLPAPVSVGEVRTVGASLGEQAVEEGVIAAGLGSLLVLIFAAVYYRLSGIVADISLALNAVFVLALLALVGATLTLPGICGIALTIGMAVDCNIIIFERIREELRGGKSIRLAIEAGFDRASIAVLDSNITTLLAGVVLYSYGSGPIKGFAVTLMIGIFTTLYTGVFVSRALMELVNGGPRARVSI